MTIYPTPTPLAQSLRTYIHSPPVHSLLDNVPPTSPSCLRLRKAQGLSPQVASFRPRTNPWHRGSRVLHLSSPAGGSNWPFQSFEESRGAAPLLSILHYLRAVDFPLTE